MSVSVENVEKNVVALQVTVEAEKFAQAVDQAAKSLAKRVNVPGFRKGKAPRRMVELQVGKAALYDEALDHIIGPAYAQAVEESGINPVDRPDVELVQIEEGKELIFKAKVVVRPEVILGDYKGLEIEQDVASVTEEEVVEELKGRQQQHARLLSIEDGKIEDGDIVTLDFEGFTNDVPFAGGKAENYELVIGSGTFIPGFEEGLIGAEVGKEIDVNVTFPDEYHSAELAGQKAVFKCNVKKVQRKELSPLDDEFAKDVSEFDTLDELKNDLRNKLMKIAESKVKDDHLKAIITKVVDNASVEIPEAMFTQRIDEMFEELNTSLIQQGMNMDQYYQFTNSSEEIMRERLRPQAVESVKRDLVLEAVAKAEGITVTEDEVNEGLKNLSERFKQDPALLKQSLLERGQMEFYKQSLIQEKTVNFLVEQNA
ncbi:trigger factor [Desulfosporosinus acidiphilus SJ4]|uniref:Trigger factor n=1 Tax=Desulfosporosinus acidiphilus (strain DSM 22704 / JCM 16185 / SJ4) TaxID=646529 RepID=I4DBL2_DESAJ|nr:trigger factor [Desulfosporosinus acidiphilus]AFM43186.1 trigger factor [Desulfosporosinus acidiphilus SJ4]